MIKAIGETGDALNPAPEAVTPVAEYGPIKDDLTLPLGSDAPSAGECASAVQRHVNTPRRQACSRPTARIPRNTAISSTLAQPSVEITVAHGNR